MGNSKIVERVKKLLAMAHSEGNEHEAESAMLLAQKMMAENGLTMTDVKTNNSEQKEAIHAQMSEWGKTIWWKKQLATVIGNNFKCYPYVKKVYGKSSLVMIGLKEDTEIAKEVFEFAIETVTKQATSYVNKIKRAGGNTRGVRNDWIRGFISGLDEKFKEQVNKNNWGLVLVRDEVVEKEINNMKFGKAKQSRVTSARNAQARHAGYQKGQEFASQGCKKGSLVLT